MKRFCERQTNALQINEYLCVQDSPGDRTSPRDSAQIYRKETRYRAWLLFIVNCSNTTLLDYIPRFSTYLYCVSLFPEKALHQLYNDPVQANKTSAEKWLLMVQNAQEAWQLSWQLLQHQVRMAVQRRRWLCCYIWPPRVSTLYFIPVSGL